MTKQSTSTSLPIWDKFVNWIGIKPPVIWLYKRVGQPVDKFLLRRSKGRYSLLFGKPVGILTTVGAKTGLAREKMLLYAQDGKRLILIASNYGNQKHPAWYRNLTKNPQVTFTYQGKVEKFIAQTADKSERETLWEKCLANYAGFDVYQDRATRREIPVVVLEPDSED